MQPLPPPPQNTQYLVGGQHGRQRRTLAEGEGPEGEGRDEKAGTGERKGKKLVTLFDFLCLREQAMGSILGVL